MRCCVVALLKKRFTKRKNIFEYRFFHDESKGKCLRTITIADVKRQFKN